MQSDNRRSTQRTIAGAVLGIYALALTAIAFWPTPVDRGLDPLLGRVLRRLHTLGIPKFVNYDFVERSANIALFVPAGLLIALLLPRRLWWLAIVIGAATSGLIELSQLLFLPARYASWMDIATNTTGAIIGVALALLIQRRPRRYAPRHP